METTVKKLWLAWSGATTETTGLPVPHRREKVGKQCFLSKKAIENQQMSWRGNTGAILSWKENRK